MLRVCAAHSTDSSGCKLIFRKPQIPNAKADAGVWRQANVDLKMPATFPAREGGIMCMCSVELEAWPVLSAGPSIIVRRLAACKFQLQPS